mmetsp:Transcript_93998/g.236876  ORF Transcript_93998/g.236876 Transcript_93998/m.236876 type:complete len:228 (+) Transcript_93998:367-1050(+)
MFEPHGGSFSRRRLVRTAMPECRVVGVLLAAAYPAPAPARKRVRPGPRTRRYRPMGDSASGCQFAQHPHRSIRSTQRRRQHHERGGRAANRRRRRVLDGSIVSVLPRGYRGNHSESLAGTSAAGLGRILVQRLRVSHLRLVPAVLELQQGRGLRAWTRVFTLPHPSFEHNRSAALRLQAESPEPPREVDGFAALQERRALSRLPSRVGRSEPSLPRAVAGKWHEAPR